MREQNSNYYRDTKWHVKDTLSTMLEDYYMRYISTKPHEIIENPTYIRNFSTCTIPKLQN